MGRNKHIYSDIEIAQLMSETYCSACSISLYDPKYKKGKLAQIFERHCNTNKHKYNMERYRLLDKSSSSINDIVNDEKIIMPEEELASDISKIQPFIHENLLDDNFTSISSNISNNKSLSILYKLDEKYSNINSNYYQLKSEHQKILDENIEFKNFVNYKISNLEKKYNNNSNYNSQKIMDVSGEKIPTISKEKLKTWRLLLDQYELLCDIKTNKNSIDNNISEKLANICSQLMKINNPL